MALMMLDGASAIGAICTSIELTDNRTDPRHSKQTAAGHKNRNCSICANISPGGGIIEESIEEYASIVRLTGETLALPSSTACRSPCSKAVAFASAASG